MCSLLEVSKFDINKNPLILIKMLFYILDRESCIVRNTLQQATFITKQSKWNCICMYKNTSIWYLLNTLLFYIPPITP